MLKNLSAIKNLLDTIIFCIKTSYTASRKYFIIRIIIEVFMSILPFTVLILSRAIINTLASVVVTDVNFKQATQRFTLLIILLISFEILSTLIKKVKDYCSSIHKDLISRQINEQIAVKSMSLDLSYFDSTALYNEITNIRRDSNALETLTWFMIDLVRSLLQLCFSVIILARLNPLFTLFIVAAGIPSILVEKKYTAELYNWQRKRAPEERKMGYVLGILTGRQYAKDIRLFNIQDFLMSIYKSIWQHWFKEKRNISYKKAKWVTLLSILPRLSAFALLFQVGFLIISRTLTLGDYSFYSGMLGELIGGLYAVISTITKLYDSNMKITNFSKFMDWKSTIENKGSIIPVLPLQIVFSNVSFKYPGVEEYVLNNATFTINSNERIALVGTNGAGKSTIVKLILRYYDPTEGIICINGNDIKEYNINELRKMFSVMFQDYVNYAFTLRDNITLSNFAEKGNDKKILDACLRSDLDPVISKLDAGLDTYLTREFEENGRELSGGEWQKVALARTFFRNGQFIILDEPSASLDPEAEHRIFQKFMELCEGKGAIFISHRLSNVTTADRIIVLEKGNIVETGTHEELLMKSGKYSYLFNLQAEKYKGIGENKSKKIPL